MRRTHLSIALTLPFTLLTSLSVAQDDVDVERFKPAVTTDGRVLVESSRVRPPSDPWTFGAYLQYAYSPLVVVDAGGDVVSRIVSGRLGVDLFASLSLANRLDVALDLPVFLLQSGRGDPSFAGLGDLRLVPKLNLLSADPGLGLALVAEVRAPTHVGDFAGGTRLPVFAPRLALDVRTRGGLTFAANAGVLLRERTAVQNLDAASEATYAAGLGVRPGGRAGPTELGAQLVGGVGLTDADTEELPLEALAYVRHELTGDLAVVVGPGAGLIAGYGVPTFRVFAGVTYAPTRHDSDRDGVPDDLDRCPTEAEDRDGHADQDGCPEEDGDVDGIPDELDRCPNEKETINGFQDEDGCPDEGPARVIYKDGKIVILENVKFKPNSWQIEEASHSILDQVALVLKANPEIKRLRVEGHTDETGTRETNLFLSKQRAKAVRDYLVNKGVKADRLTFEGYGPDKPIATGSDPESRAKNRRVDFILEQ